VDGFWRKEHYPKGIEKDRRGLFRNVTKMGIGTRKQNGLNMHRLGQSHEKGRLFYRPVKKNRGTREGGNIGLND